MAPKARPWQDQEILDAAATAKRDTAFEEIACALIGDDDNHRELRRAYLMFQVFYEWTDADFFSEQEMKRFLDNWISQTQNSGTKEIATAAGSIKNVKKYILNAYRTDRTNAYAGSINRKIKDMKRRVCGFTNFKSMRRRLLLAFGYPPMNKGGVSLPNHNK
ncbi:transposase [Adlercreutzia sp. ZJ154]|uniref:transposase n=1 Tax=Adlercreutzia sp. ZJ154 TaxID=2709790 RepID=UPI0013EB141A|nr:transposase [Adlercreutzia sp. ZJ154]